MQTAQARQDQIRAIHPGPAFEPFREVLAALARHYGDSLHIQVSDYSHRINVALQLPDGRFIGPLNLNLGEPGTGQLFCAPVETVRAVFDRYL